MSGKYDVQWEDEDTGFEELESAAADKKQSEFEELFDESSVERNFFRIGDSVTATVSSINSTSGDVLLDLGGKDTGVIGGDELKHEDGTSKVKIGDEVKAFIVSKSNGEIVLSQSMNHKVAKDHAIDTAIESKLPVKGKVTGHNKGGFQVQVLGKKAFCPISQISNQFVEEGTEKAFVGKEFDFLVTQKKGRELVVSRKALLQQQGAEVIEKLQEQIDEKPVLDGTVTSVRDFGAMVDIGGVDGMVHISEISWSRVAHPSEAVSVGDRKKVKLLSIDTSGKLPRISLSFKQAEQDPWTAAGEKYKENESYVGTVTRLMAFGAFVELEPGIEGLVHISELAWGKRINHPKEVVSEGDKLTVRILSVDTVSNKISLSNKQIDEDPWFEIEKKLPLGSHREATVESLKGFGAIAEVAPGITGLLPISTMKKAFGENYRKKASPPQTIEVKIANIDKDNRKVLLTLPNIETEDEDQGDFREYLKVQKAKAEKAKKSIDSSVGSFGQLLQQAQNKKS